MDLTDNMLREVRQVLKWLCNITQKRNLVKLISRNRKSTSWLPETR